MLPNRAVIRGYPIKPQLENTELNSIRPRRWASFSRRMRRDSTINAAWSSRAIPSEMANSWSSSCSSGRWNATSSIQGETTYITRLLMVREPRSSMSLTLPSTKPTAISRYSVMI